MNQADKDKVIAALEAVDALINHQYTGSRDAMSALQNAADDCLEALAIMRGVAAEPVAWLAPNSSAGEQGEQKYIVTADDTHEAIKELLGAFPVYTSPQAAAPEQEGWTRVPIEPTPEMCQAGGKAMFTASWESEDAEAADIYRACDMAATASLALLTVDEEPVDVVDDVPMAEE